jgi:hypothetical protein
MAIFSTAFEGDSPASVRPGLATANPPYTAVVRHICIERLRDEPAGTSAPLSTRLAHPLERSKRRIRDEVFWGTAHRDDWERHESTQRITAARKDLQGML